MMDRKHLLTTLGSLFSKKLKAISVLSKIPDINRGGCGIAALAMYRYLGKKNLEILFLYRNFKDEDYENNQRVINGDTSCIPSAPLHVVLRKNGKFFDSTGDLDDNYVNFAYLFQHTCTEKFLTDAIKKADNWRSIFNREHIKEIEQKLKVDLSDVKN